jgi:hypothetical protein
MYFLSIIKNQYLIKTGCNVYTNHLEALYERNNISKTEVKDRMFFLGQLDIRARRRELLEYTLYIAPYRPSSGEILIIELPIESNYKDELSEITKSLQVFSQLGQVKTANRMLYTMPGMNHEHPVCKLIKNVISEKELEADYYTIKSGGSQFIPFHELYDFEEKKWK